jgi:small subunit ribosomal protein S16
MRVGRKHDPTFRVVVTDSRRAPRSGAYLENLGFCNPRRNDFQLKADRIKSWLSKGAQVSDSVYNLLITGKVIEGKKRNVFKTKKKAEKPKEEQPKDVKTEHK